MIYYCYLICAPADFLLRKLEYRALRTLLFIIVFLFYVVLIGSRDTIGVDWYNYEAIYRNGSEFVFDVSTIQNVGYYYLIYISNLNNLSYEYFNFWIAFITLSLVFWSIKRSNYALTQITFIAPYFFNIALMNYSRQSLSVAILFFLVYNRNKLNLLLKGILDAVSISIHPSHLVVLTWTHSRVPKILLLITLSSLSIFIAGFLAPYIELYFKNGMSSQGAVPRLLVYGSPFIFTIFFKIPIHPSKKFAFNVGLTIGLFCVALTLSGNSTLADRIALFLLPFSSLIVSEHVSSPKNGRILALFYTSLSLALFIVWSQFSFWSGSWYPYKSWLL